MTKESRGNMRDAVKKLKELGCTVSKKHRTGEWLIILPDGSRHLASGTRKDTPSHVVGLIKKLRQQ